MIVRIMKTVKLSSTLYLRAGDVYDSNLSPLPKEVKVYLDRPDIVKVLVSDPPSPVQLEQVLSEAEPEPAQTVRRVVKRRTAKKG